MAHWITDANSKRIKVAGNYKNNKKLELIELWYNSNFSTFTYGVVTIPEIINYNMIAVMFRALRSSTKEDFLIMANVEENRSNLVNCLSWDNVYKRVFITGINTINFDKGYTVPSYASSGLVENNDVIIPVKVFGVK